MSLAKGPTPQPPSQITKNLKKPTIFIGFSLFFNKNPPRRPKTPPRHLQDVPRRLQDTSKTPQDAPRRLQDTSKTSQDASKMPQDAPSLRYPKMPQVPQHTSTSHMHPGAGHGGRCGRRRLDIRSIYYSKGTQTPQHPENKKKTNAFCFLVPQTRYPPPSVALPRLISKSIKTLKKCVF